MTDKEKDIKLSRLKKITDRESNTCDDSSIEEQTLSSSQDLVRLLLFSEAPPPF